MTQDAEENAYFENEVSDFCADLEDEQLIALGVTEDTIEESMYKVAVANKYQSLLAEMEDTAYEAYDYDGEAYQKLLETHECVSNDEVWERIPLGHITVNQK